MPGADALHSGRRRVTNSLSKAFQAHKKPSPDPSLFERTRCPQEPGRKRVKIVHLRQGPAKASLIKKSPVPVSARTVVIQSTTCQLPAHPGTVREKRLKAGSAARVPRGAKPPKVTPRHTLLCMCLGKGNTTANKGQACVLYLWRVRCRSTKSTSPPQAFIHPQTRCCAARVSHPTNHSAPGDRRQNCSMGGE